MATPYFSPYPKSFIIMTLTASVSVLEGSPRKKRGMDKRKSELPRDVHSTVSPGLALLKYAGTGVYKFARFQKVREKEGTLSTSKQIDLGLSFQPS